MRETARRVPHRARVGQIVGRRRLGEHLIPEAEAHLREQRREVHVLHHAAHRRIAHHVRVHLRADIVGGLQRVGAPAFEGRGRDEEVDVVRVVAGLIHHVARHRIAGEVRLVGLDGVDVGHRRVVVSTGPQIDVSRHVHDVAGARHERRQLVGVLLGAARVGRRFDGVNVQMNRAGMVVLAREHRLERRDHLVRELAAGCRPAPSSSTATYPSATARTAWRRRGRPGTA